MESNWMDRNVKVLLWKKYGRWSPSSTIIIEDVDRVLEALEIIYRTHGAAVEGLADLPEGVIVQWSVEAVSEAKTRHH